MARKKIIFVIVEGPSDEEALGVILNRIYDSNAVYVHIMHKDITTEFVDAPNKNIITMIGDEIRGYANANHFKKTDFKAIIHLVDTDGAFIPDEGVIEDASAVKPYYTTENIRTCNKASIESRNKRKRENINRLCDRRKIWDVPYSVFYMSCNLDHVLYNKLNISNDEKEHYAYKFAKTYKDKIPQFLDFIKNSAFSVVTGYNESWDFIKTGLHSLERYTNIGICFDEKDSSVDSFTGILKGNYNDKQVKAERIENKEK